MTPPTCGADANQDGAISLPFQDNNGDGVIDGDDLTEAELKIGSIQELIDALTGILDPIEARFNNGELTFTIDYFRSFESGDGDVQTTTPGVKDVTSEVQEVTYDDTVVEAYRLSIVDGNGALQMTAVIPTVDGDGNPLDDADIRDDIELKLEAVSGIGENIDSVTGGNGAFTITF